MSFGIKSMMTVLALVAALASGCGGTVETPNGAGDKVTAQHTTAQQSSPAPSDTSHVTVDVSATETQLVPGLSAVRYEGEYGLDDFLEQGGAASDTQVVKFLTAYLGGAVPSIQTKGFGCSALSVSSPEGHALFGRNFDWSTCEALIVQSVPKEGYASISTVNMGFLGNYLDKFPAQARTTAALYAPLDGMNEKGLCVAVLMIQDNASINQNTGKPDLTTTTAVRLLLDKAADVEEALALLEQYDLHASMGMMVHFALSDAEGNSAAVEYIENKMVVTETPVLTNFYLAEGNKQGIGTSQSHTRYNILMDTLNKSPSMTLDQVRDAMDSVSKDNFGEFESTEWTAVYDQSTGEVRYYHRENYQTAYLFQVEQEQEKS